ncbi:MAG: hypothetical protein K2W96_05990 [Gemmataceae bacterium]|nr:hypothetical protein [Gemmataceae bacterium]
MIPLAALCLAFAPAPFLPRKKPVAALEGAWVQVAAGGRPVVRAARGNLTIVIGGGRWSFDRDNGPGGKPARTAYFLSHDGTTFDLRRAASDPKPYGLGIWRIDGDDLRIAYGWSGVRPTAFDASGPNFFNMVLRRAK